MTPTFIELPCTDCCDLTIAVRGIRAEARAQGFAPYNGLGPNRYLTKCPDGAAIESSGTAPPGCTPEPYDFLVWVGSLTLAATPGEDPRILGFVYHATVEDVVGPPDCTVTAGSGGTLNVIRTSYCGTLCSRYSYTVRNDGTFDVDFPDADSCPADYSALETLTETRRSVVGGTPAFRGAFELSDVDTLANVTSRLSAARTSGHAYAGTGIISGNYASLQDSDYPSLRYFNGQYASYYRFHLAWRSACTDPGGTGTVGFDLDSKVFGHGLDMAKDEYFKNPYAPFETAVAWAKRHEHQAAMFEGCFSAYARGGVTGGLSLQFEQVTVPLWASLQKVPACSGIPTVGSPEVAGGSTETTGWTLELSEPLSDPMDSLGSMALGDSSWAGAWLKRRDWSSSADVAAPAFRVAAFCSRHKVRLWSPVPCTVTAERVVVNYKDAFDAGFPGLVGSPVITTATLTLTTAFDGGFYSAEYDAAPANNCQEIWLRPTAVSAGAVADLRVLSKARTGAPGFPQLDHAKDAIVWEGGKVFKGYRKNTAWHGKQTFTYSHTATNTGACRDSCVEIVGEELDFATEIIIEQEVDTTVDYTGGISEEDTVRAVCGQPWHYVSAVSANGAATFAAPTGEHYDHPPVWGCIGYDTITATTASRVRTNTGTIRYIAALTASHLPIRNLYGQARYDQDYMANFFLQNQAAPGDPEEHDGCPEGNQTCPLYTPPCYEEPYSAVTHRAGGDTIDPFYGYSSATQTASTTVTLALDQGANGFYGEELPEISPGVYDTAQLLTDETSDVNGRIYSPIASSGLYAVDVPASGHYIVLRDVRLN